MNGEPLAPSKPEDIGRGTTVIELVEPGPAGPIRIRITSLHPSRLIEILGGISGVPVNTEPDPAPINALAVIRKTLEDTVERFKAIAELTAVEPRFSFGEQADPGTALWSALSFRNQKDYVEQVSKYSGAYIDVNSPDGEAAATAARFPENAGRA
jgi:hypothetical protein